MHCEFFIKSNTWKTPLIVFNFKMMNRIFFICMCLFFTIFGKVGNAQENDDIVYAAQPKIITQNGHLIFMSASNHNITFRSQGSGSIRINNEDLSSVVLSAKQSVADLQRIKDEEIVVMRQNIQQLQNQMSTVNQLMDRVNDIETSLRQISQMVAGGANGTRRQSQEQIRLRRRVQRLKTRLDNLEEILGKNECNSNPCRNGGTCVDGFNGFSCKCTSNWEGPTCETDFNECTFYAGTDLGCKNGATCVNTNGGFSCQCPPDYYGTHCSERHDDCSSSINQAALCGHGTCINQLRTQPGLPRYTCICDEGWTTDGRNPACVIDIDECQTGRSLCSQHPMVQCINLPGSFSCGPCPTGYIGSGFTCMDINECINDNGGCSVSPFVQCVNTPGSRQCGPCPTGFQGNGEICTHAGLCGVNNGGCHPLATCIENPAISSSYLQCRCPQGYIGNGFGPQGCIYQSSGGDSGGGTHVIPPGDPCNPNPCNGGTCVAVSAYSFRCNCPLGYGGQLCEIDVNECNSQPCQNSGTCVDRVNGYTCNCPSQFTGNNCEQEQDACGGIINEPNGTFRYPSTIGVGYPHDRSCAWVITTTFNKVLNITFPEFYLEATAGCEYDFLQLNDGSSVAAHNIGRFCGTTAPNGGNVITTHNSVYIWFHSDSSVARDGFQIKWESINPVCGGEIRPPVDYGTIKSPGYPGQYPSNRDCVWIVRVPLGKRIQFLFPTLQIEHHDNCNYDFLEIRDGALETDPVLGTYCSTRAPPPLLSSGSFARLYFHSDSSLSDYGFIITFNSVPGIPGCGGMLTGDRGAFSSPDHPNQYEHGLECDWLIRVLPNERIKLIFTNMDLERHVNCAFDYVAVYDGADDTAPLVGRYCSKTIPPERHSTGNVMFIKFHSDYSIAHGGFRATFEVVCGGTYTSPQGIVHSPYFPNYYPHSRECIYLIHVPIGKAIRLWFEAFDVEGSSTCTFDYLQINDGETASSPALGKFCGSQIPDTIISTYNFLWLKFATDASVRNRGFLANYTSIDVGCGGIFHNQTTGIISSPNHPEQYLHNMTCRWIIRPPSGFLVRLAFSTFVLESSGNCRFDYVAVYDNVTAEDNNKLMGKFCGHQLPPLLTSSDNLLYVTFRSDVSVARDGFTAQFTTFNASTLCGGEYYTTLGVIKSPNFPNGYPHGRQCVWTINVQKGQQILLNITDFNLEAQQECRYDYLEIRNGGYMTSPLIGKYCGMQIPNLIPSHSNQLFLKFVSDSSMSSPGFQIFWDGTTTGCGGELDASQGSISSPGYPMGCSYNVECNWRITVNRGNKIKLMFTDLDVLSTTSCSSGVQFFDGNSAKSNSLGRFCGSHIVDPFTSSGNEVFIKYRCSGYPLASKRGFLLSYATECNTTVSGKRGVIETPNFPNRYPHNRNCTWTINSPLGSTINMSFSLLRLEHAPNCSFDFVAIKENGFRNKTSLGKYCGANEVPPQIFSTTNSVKVNFVSDFDYADSGFALEWVSNGCGELLTKSSGNFTSPNYPNAYPPNMICEWQIRVDYGKVIELTFHEYDIESGRNCIFDSIKVYSSEGANAPLITSLCHAQTSPTMLTSSDNQLFIKFRSDVSVVAKGFLASYIAKPGGCGGRFTVPKGAIHSRNFPNFYNALDDCTWLITIAKGHTIFLNFTDFDIRPASNCSAVYVAVYDGATENDTLLMKHCGSQLPNPLNFSSTTNEVLIRMRAHNTISSRGFQLIYYTGCGATLYADEPGAISSNVEAFSNYLTKRLFANIPLNCTWIIRARNLEDRVALTMTSLNIRRTYAVGRPGLCPTHYINIYDGESNDSVLIDQLCHNMTLPPTYTTRGNVMKVQLNSRPNFITFRAIYYEASTSCGGDLNALQGTFTSPEYPNSYPVEIECVWTISSAPGNNVRATFSFFKLEESDYCNKDYVEIREMNAMGRLLGRYCGSEIPTLNFTAHHQLWVKFRSDIDGVGEGFVASYSIMHESFLTGPYGQIASPLYPQLLNKVGNFAWTITVDPYKVVAITFSDMYVSDGSAAGRRLFQITSQCTNGLKIYDGVDETSELIGDICHIGNPDPVVSRGNVVYIVLTIRWESKRVKFLLNWNATVSELPDPYWPTYQPTYTTNITGCGGTLYLNDTDGRDHHSLVSPGNLEGYQDNLRCEWFFYAPIFSSVGITFSVLNLEDSYDCNADYVQIWGLGAVPGQWENLGKHCRRDETTTSIRSYSNAMKVNFNTDSSVNRTGFSAYLYPECGGNVSASSGILQSFRYPYSYVNDLNCNWLITVRPGRRIQVEFNDFQLQGDMPACPYDYLILRNGMSINSPLFGKYCGRNKPELIETVGNHLYVQFVTDSEIVSKGFQLRYSEISVSCGGVIMLNDLEPSVTIKTPNYPSAYPYLTDCSWRILAPARKRIQFYFEESFDIPLSEGCQSDYLLLHDGGTRNSPLLGRFCGSSHQMSTLQSTSNAMYVEFSSVNEHPSTGFKATIKLGECGGTIVADEGVITSPNYPLSYAANLDCEWIIHGPSGHFLVMNFVDLQTSVIQNNCSVSDYVQIREYNASGTILGDFCGLNTSTIVQSADNVVHVRFRTKQSSPVNRGFILHFNKSLEECGGEFSTPTGIITTPNFPLAYPRNRVCIWTIRAMKGRKVRLTFTHFNMDSENADYCLNYVSVFNSDSLIYILPPFHYCGNRILPPSLSTSNVMSVKFSSTSQVMGTGFRAIYDTDLEWDCGGDIPFPSGNLTSPGYGIGNYSHNLMCDWSLVNPQQNGSFVFQINEFSLERPIQNNNCKYDALDIRGEYDSTEIAFASLCGTLQPQVFAFPFSQVYLKLRTDQSVTHVGFSITYSVSDCGGLISGLGTTLSSPGYSFAYPNDIHCAWAGIFSEEQQVQITFTEFHLESSLNCTNDYVLIRNGLSVNSPVIGRYCGDVKPKEIRTQSHEVLIEFHSNSNTVSQGFRIDVVPVSSGCGGVFHSSNGIITSVGYPNDYPNNIECEWIFEGEPGYFFNVSFIERFDLELDSSCSKDFLEGFDFIDHTWMSIGQRCGRDIPLPFISKSYKFRMIFRSNDGVMADGFKANWTKTCGGVFMDLEGVFESPGYPVSYSNYLDCRYLISTDPGHYVVVAFDSNFKIEDHSKCLFDAVEIYGGNSTQAPQLKRTCGATAPTNITHLGPVLIRFTTDSSGTFAGFRVSYRISECGGILRSPGIISSPMHPNKYHANMNCTWTIIAPVNRVVFAKFLLFDIESHSSCIFDFLKIYDGNSTSSSLIGQYCGNLLPPSVKSTGSNMTLSFITDSVIENTGFILMYRFTYGESVGCGGLLNATSGIIQSVDIDRDGKYESGLECGWIISAPEFKAVQLTFQSFQLEQPQQGAPCTWDYLEIRDGLSEYSPLISRYCGDNLPPQITSSSNNLYLKFVSDESYNRAGFYVSYSTVDPECGGVLNVTNMVQIIESPGYPANYRINLRCLWVIDNPTQIPLQLRFEDLRLENSSNCQKDHVTIQQIHSWQKQLAKYCGSIIPSGISVPRYVPKINVMFSSDSSQTDKGFRLLISTAQCNNMTYTEPYGNFKMDYYYPQDSSVDFTCIQKITVPTGMSITLSFTQFSIPLSLNCSSNYLEVRDGSNETAPLLYKLCGWILPSPVFSTQNNLWLKLYADDTRDLYYGAVYYSTDKGPGCGGRISADIGVITSPYYPGNYSRESICLWEVLVAHNHNIYIRFQDMNIYPAGNCTTNYLEVYDGLAVDESHRLGYYCGDPYLASISTTTNSMLLRYVTNSFNNGTGFKIEFQGVERGQVEPPIIPASKPLERLNP